jgi:hypothetical protein
MRIHMIRTSLRAIFQDEKVLYGNWNRRSPQ